MIFRYSKEMAEISANVSVQVFFGMPTHVINRLGARHNTRQFTCKTETAAISSMDRIPNSASIFFRILSGAGKSCPVWFLPLSLHLHSKSGCHSLAKL